jgi:hypothetical protein
MLENDELLIVTAGLGAVGSFLSSEAVKPRISSALSVTQRLFDLSKHAPSGTAPIETVSGVGVWLLLS